jgi:hypothetical protein
MDKAMESLIRCMVESLISLGKLSSQHGSDTDAKLKKTQKTLFKFYASHWVTLFRTWAPLLANDVNVFANTWIAVASSLDTLFSYVGWCDYF